MAKEKKLSKRAEKLLAEIQSSAPDDMVDHTKTVIEVDQNSSLEYFYGGIGKFTASKYRKNLSYDKKPLWAFNLIILTGVFIFVSNLAWSFYDDYANKLNKNKKNLPKILAEIKNIETNAANIQKEVFEKKQFIQSELEKIPNQHMADEIINEVAQLLESSELRIVKQEIQINKSITSVTFGMPTIQKPIADNTVFSNIAIASLENTQPQTQATKKEDKKTKTKTKTKTKKEDKEEVKIKVDEPQSNFSEMMELIKKQENEKKQKLIKDLPKNVSFMNYHFQLKGQYLNYLKVRQHLIKRYPYLIIPVEEIATEKNNTDIQFRVIYDIPFFTENTTMNVNNKGT